MEGINKKLSKLECYLGLNREYTVAEYLTTVTDPKLFTFLTTYMYRLGEHSLAIEKRRCRQTWLSRDDRLCAHSQQNEVETELHFLTSCQMYDHIETHISLRLQRPTRNWKTNPIFINSHIYCVKYHSVPSQQQETEMAASLRVPRKLCSFLFFYV